MNDTYEKIKFNDELFPEDTLEVQSYTEHVSFYSTEIYDETTVTRTIIQIKPEQARQLATFLSDYADQQGV